jgi:stringent starvation protein B
MTPRRPYLIRAVYQWVLDNGCTPHVLVNAGLEGVQVPVEYVRDGQIVLNLTPSAVKDLYIGNDRMELSARFGGVARPVSVPVAAVLALYARENGQGMVFADEGPVDEPPPPTRPERPTLKVVK